MKVYHISMYSFFNFYNNATAPTKLYLFYVGEGITVSWREIQKTVLSTNHVTSEGTELRISKSNVGHTQTLHSSLRSLFQWNCCDVILQPWWRLGYVTGEYEWAYVNKPGIIHPDQLNPASVLHSPYHDRGTCYHPISATECIINVTGNP